MVEVRVFVGNLPYSATASQLKELVTPVVSGAAVFVPTDRATGRSRGFAFVEVSSEAEAREVIRKLNGYMLDDRRLRAELATERPAERGYRPTYRAPFGRRGRPEPRRRRPERAPSR
jgi:RNA recognition motif-containing protein